MKYHPDRNKAKNASEKFKEIQKAFQTLSDPNERSKYDRKL
jgi:DnaJ-class molecular chaperone with C-terminal Zn finger domain